MRDVWQIELLGHLCLRRGDTALTHFRTQQAGLLVAYLSLSPRLRRRDELVELLWENAPPLAGRNRLSQAIAWLRPHLETPDEEPGATLFANRTHVALTPGSYGTDVTAFEAKLQQANSSGRGRDERIKELEEAVSLYGGELLPGCYQNWILHERRRLQEVYLRLLVNLATLLRERGAQGDFTNAGWYVRQALAIDPAREEAHLELMRTLAATGEPAAVRRQFRELEQALAITLGESPSDKAVALAQELRVGHITPLFGFAQEARLSVPQSVAEPDTQTNATRTFHGLPVPLTRFFGREKEVDIVKKLYRDGVRFITIVGPGGNGKTRLAIEVAHRLVRTKPHNISFVSLAEISVAQQILPAVADALHRAAHVPQPPMETQPTPLEQIQAILARVPAALLVLDNLEHLAVSSPAILKDLLDACPDLSLIATSRQRIGVYGEREVRLPPLPFPTKKESVSLSMLSSSPSVQLFVDRAQAVRDTFLLDRSNASTIAALCERLEGLPLAIELCAAWASVMSPAQMLKELTNRFDLLVSSQEGVPDRHRSLRAAIEYSVALLPDDLRNAFFLLSVFRGGWTLEAAAFVCGLELPTAREILIRLRERSLVLSEESAADDTMRFRMLETLREFASARLQAQELDSAARRHADYYLERAETLAGRKELGTGMALRYLEVDQENHFTALRWYEGKDDFVEKGLRLSIALWNFWLLRANLREGADWLATFSDAASQPERDFIELRAEAKYMQARLLYAAGEQERALPAAEQALDWARGAKEWKPVVQALHLNGIVLSRLGNFDLARAMHREGIAIAGTVGSDEFMALHTHGLGSVSYLTRDWEEARTSFSSCLQMFRQLERPRSEAVTLNALGLVARHTGSLEDAWDYFEQALVIRERVANKSGQATTLVNQGTIYRLRGELEKARAKIKDSLIIAREVGNRYVLAWCLKEQGHLEIAGKSFGRGVFFLGAADRIRESQGINFRPADPDEREQDLDRSRQEIGPRLVTRLWNEGRAAELESVVDEIIGEDKNL